MSKTYESLTGASGRQRFFRPKRYAAQEFFSGTPPKLFFDDEEFDLDNISLRGAGGVGRQAEASEKAAANDVGGLLRLTQRGKEIFRAQARKARSSVNYSAVNAGFELESAEFDLHQLVRENAAVLAAQQPRPESLQLPAAYKEFCADVSSFVGGCLLRIDKHIAPIEQSLSEEERNDVARKLADAAEGQWRSLLHKGNALSAEAHDDKILRVGMKSFTENTVTQTLMEAPGWARCYQKPSGYPGDYQMMNYGYEQKPEGMTVRQKFLHLLGMIASKSILARREKLSSLIVDYATANAPAGEGEFAIASVGCGPARELEDIIDATADGVSWDVTLIDQEPEALEYAFKNVIPECPPQRLKAKGLNISFREMLKPTQSAAIISQCDIVYSSGFVDYLNPLLAQRFTKRMYDFVKPGGRVIIGNVNNLESGMIWPLEYVTDWSLYFRGEDEMYAIAREIPDAKVSVHADETDAIFFLVVEKPKGVA